MFFFCVLLSARRRPRAGRQVPHTHMVRCATLVIGPAGAGKSTYCNLMRTHCEAQRRRVHVVNLDPAAEHFRYPVAADIRDLVPLEDVMSELRLGPNGGLIYAMEYLVDNIDWLESELDDLGAAARLPPCAAAAAAAAARGFTALLPAPLPPAAAAAVAPALRLCPALARSRRRSARLAAPRHVSGGDEYVLFDCPGQVELNTTSHHIASHRIAPPPTVWLPLRSSSTRTCPR